MTKYTKKFRLELNYWEKKKRDLENRTPADRTVMLVT